MGQLSSCNRNMKLAAVSIVLVVVGCSALCDAASAKQRTRSGKPLLTISEEEETQKPFSEDANTDINIPEPLRLLVDKIADYLENGQDIPSTDSDLLPEIRHIVESMKLLCEQNKHCNFSRDSRGMLKRIRIRPLNFFQGSGSISASQRLTILGRIIRSVFSLKYGPQSDFGSEHLDDSNVDFDQLQNDPLNVDVTSKKPEQDQLELDHKKIVEELDKQIYQTNNDQSSTEIVI